MASLIGDRPGGVTSLLSEPLSQQLYSLAMSYERAMYYGAPNFDAYARRDTVPLRVAALKNWRPLLDVTQRLELLHQSIRSQQQTQPAVSGTGSAALPGASGGGAFRAISSSGAGAAPAAGGGSGAGEAYSVAALSDPSIQAKLASMIAQAIAPKATTAAAAGTGTPVPGAEGGGGCALGADGSLAANHVNSSNSNAADAAAVVQAQQQQAQAPRVTNPHDLRQQQCARLMMLSHAYRCRRDNRGDCKESQCPYFRFLWGHLEQCNSSACTVKHCVSSRFCIDHYRNCTDPGCDICVPVRVTLANDVTPGLSAPAGLVAGTKRQFGLDGSGGGGGAGEASQSKRSRIDGVGAPQQAAVQQMPSASDLERLNPSQLGIAPADWARMSYEERLGNYLRARQMVEAYREAERQRAAAAAAQGAQQQQQGQGQDGQPKPKKGKLDGDCCLVATFNREEILQLMTGLRDDFNADVTPELIRLQVTQLLSALMEHPMAWIFNTPVDPVKLNLPDYFDYIKRPMDLGTIRKRLDSNQYRTLKAFIYDVRLVWSNALAYNPPGTEVHQLAWQFSQRFEEAVARIEGNYHTVFTSNIQKPNHCTLCGGGEFNLEPPTLYCNQCATRLKKGMQYYTTAANKYHLCQGCYSAAKKAGGGGPELVYDGQTLQLSAFQKKKVEYDAKEPWVECDNCKKWQHQVCTLYNGKRCEGTNIPHYCPTCLLGHLSARKSTAAIAKPVRGAKALPRSRLSDLIEERLASLLESRRRSLAIEAGKADDDPPDSFMPDFTVRMVSCTDKTLLVQPEFLDRYRGLGYPSQFNYRSKALVLWQRIGGVDVFIYGVYVQEYGDDSPEPNRRCAYLSYLDSVKYLEPQSLRTEVYHEILIAYLDDLRTRGFNQLTLWSCVSATPPQRYLLHCWHASFRERVAGRSCMIGLIKCSYVYHFTSNFLTSPCSPRSRATTTSCTATRRTRRRPRPTGCGTGTSACWTAPRGGASWRKSPSCARTSSRRWWARRAAWTGTSRSCPTARATTGRAWRRLTVRRSRTAPWRPPASSPTRRQAWAPTLTAAPCWPVRWVPLRRRPRWQRAERTRIGPSQLPLQLRQQLLHQPLAAVAERVTTTTLQAVRMGERVVAVSGAH